MTALAVLRLTPPWKVMRCRKGAVAVLFALLALPLMGAAGLATDMGLAYYVQSRLSHAVDAAALAVGSSTGDDDALNARAQRFFFANYPDSRFGDPYDVRLAVDGNVVTVSATADVPTTFLRLFHIDTLTVRAVGEVIRRIRGLDLALVLDNTGSMVSHDNIGALRDASRELVEILFADESVHPLLNIAVVPYSAAVNPGGVSNGLIADSGYTVPPALRASPDLGNGLPSVRPGRALGWRGCVIERDGADQLADTGAATWQPYLWEPARDNAYDAGRSATVRQDANHRNSSAGPNTGCPTPVLPLSNDRRTVLASIAAMQAWSRGGTFSDIGMAWGLRVLSPEWPFAEGRPWDEPQWDKAVVLMTDGDNQFFKLGGNDGPNRRNDAVSSDYSGYGRIDEGRLGTTSRSAGNRILDENLAEVCADMKAKGIVVYTITFTSGISEATKAIYRDCASDPGKWFDSPTQGDLRASFRAIATELSRLRLSR